MIGLSLFAYGIIFLEIPLITTFILCVDAKEMPLFLLNDRVKGEGAARTQCMLSQQNIEQVIIQKVQPKERKKK